MHETCGTLTPKGLNTKQTCHLKILSLGYLTGVEQMHVQKLYNPYFQI